jgi:hypothetical protein
MRKESRRMGYMRNEWPGGGGYFPPRCQFLLESQGVTYQKMAFFSVTIDFMLLVFHCYMLLLIEFHMCNGFLFQFLVHSTCPVQTLWWALVSVDWHHLYLVFKTHHSCMTTA